MQILHLRKKCFGKKYFVLNKKLPIFFNDPHMYIYIYIYIYIIVCVFVCQSMCFPKPLHYNQNVMQDQF